MKIKIVILVELTLYSFIVLACVYFSATIGHVHTPTPATHLDKLSDKQLSGLMLLFGRVEMVTCWPASYPAKTKMFTSVVKVNVTIFVINMHISVVDQSQIGHVSFSNNMGILLAYSQCGDNLSHSIALLGAQFLQSPNNASGALVICSLPLP